MTQIDLHQGQVIDRAVCPAVQGWCSGGCDLGTLSDGAAIRIESEMKSFIARGKNGAGTCGV